MSCSFPVGIWIRLAEFVDWAARSRTIGKLRGGEQLWLHYWDETVVAANHPGGKVDGMYSLDIRGHGKFFGLTTPVSATTYGGFRPYYRPLDPSFGTLLPIWSTDELSIFDEEPWLRMRKNPGPPRTQGCTFSVQFLLAFSELLRHEMRTQTIVAKLRSFGVSPQNLRIDDDAGNGELPWTSPLGQQLMAPVAALRFHERSGRERDYYLFYSVNKANVPPFATIVYVARNGLAFWEDASDINSDPAAWQRANRERFSEAEVDESQDRNEHDGLTHEEWLDEMLEHADAQVENWLEDDENDELSDDEIAERLEALYGDDFHEALEHGKYHDIDDYIGIRRLRQ